MARYDAELFERTVGAYCLDPHGETRAYGTGVPGSLDDVCVELFNGECEVYKRYGLERVTTLRYIDGGRGSGNGVEGAEAAAGSTASVSVTLSRFSRRSGAYGFFTKRVLSDGDPLQATVKPLRAGAAGALGSGIAYVWRGKHVLELTYISEEQTPDQLRASSARVLPRIAEALGERLPGEKKLLAEVELLPEQHLLPLGVQFEGERLLGVGGTGQGVMGHYLDGKRRWRILVAIREDEQGAGDLLQTLSHGGQGWPSPLKQQRAVKVRFAPPGDQKARVWYLARRGQVLVGVGDEVFPAPGAAEPSEADLTDTHKLKLLSGLAASVERFGAENAAAEM